MQHADFQIGLEFYTATGKWRCTDVGTRTIIAIKLDHADDPTWYDGPPYSVAERVFDEHDLKGCALTAEDIT
jgi:hypothetical protein